MFNLFRQGLFLCLASLLFLKVGFSGCSSGLSFRYSLGSVLNDFFRHTDDGLFKGVFLELAFPDDYDRPAFSLQFAPDLLVTLLVPGNFRRPEVGVGLGNRVELAGFLTMPEAAVNEDDRAIFRKHNNWRTREAPVIHPLAEAILPEGMAKLQLRLCGGGVDGGHVAMALGFRQCIRHMLRLKIQKYAFFIIFVSQIRLQIKPLSPHHGH